MSALLLLLRKMSKNKWLVLCQFLGFFIFAALIAGIPIFTQGVMHKFLVKELQQIQLEDGGYPGRAVFSSYGDRGKKTALFNQLKADHEDPYQNEEAQQFFLDVTDGYFAQKSLLESRFSSRMKMPLQDVMHLVNLKPYVAAFTEESDPVRLAQMRDLSLKVTGSEEFFGHVAWQEGRAPAGKNEAGVYEAAISSSSVVKHNFRVGDRLTLTDGTAYSGLAPVQVEIVGIYEMADTADPYWQQITPENLSENLFVDYGTFMEDFLYDGSPYFYSASWYFFFDYQKVDMSDLYSIIGGFEKTKQEFSEAAPMAFCTSYMAAVDSMKSYAVKSQQVSNMMWALYIPVIFMLCLYSFMISKMIIGNDENEIALLASRGATRVQIVGIYLLQSILIGALALVLGPLLAYGLSSVLGASNGFLEFASRKALNLTLNLDAYQYAAAAVGISIASVLIPATVASKADIVGHKRSMSRGGGMAFWEKCGLDIICLGIAGYGYYVFLQRRELMGKLDAASATDPLLFVIPVFFILGAGLLFLRLYPLLIRFIYFLGRRFWSSTAYITLTQVGRGLKSYHFLMLFLIMTLSVGMFSSIAARTIGTNTTDHIDYMVGCDVILRENWEIDKRSAGSTVAQETDTDRFASVDEEGLQRYIEPPFSKFTELAGAEHVTKVLRHSGVQLKTSAKSASGAELMAVDPYDFGMTSHMRSGLLDHSFHSYLNVLTESKSVCFLSPSLLSSLGLKVGDTVQAGWAGTPAATFVVGGVIDYWPGINPIETPDFMVADLSYVQDRINSEPYEVWVKLSEGATSQTLYDSMEAQNVRVSDYEDRAVQVAQAKNDPSQMTINGTLTLGFVVSGVICLFGFIIYWILAIRQRTLQFGIFRAMGISTKRLVGMMVLEQFLTSVAAALAGVGIGLLSGYLFVPFLELSFSPADLVPPFRIISLWSDRLVIYAMVGVTVLLGLTVLGVILSRIKINQALKLGED